MSQRGGNLERGNQLKGYSLLRTYRVYYSQVKSVRVSRYLSQRLIFQFQIEIDGSIYNFIIMQLNTTFTPSPTKRSTFRSKTKLKELGSTIESKLKSMPQFYNYVKDFPLETPEDILNLVKALEPTHNNFVQNLQNLRLYKPQLTASFEDSWAEFMQSMKSVIVKLMRRGDKGIDQKENKINALVKMNRELENKQQQWKQKIQKLQHLRQLEATQLSMADAELQIVSSQMREIYKLLQGDMQKVTTYLTKLQKARQTVNQQGSSQIFSSLKTLSTLMVSMQNQQKQAGANLTNMRELIKAMTKCSKVSTGTQVDQSELLTQAGAIFTNAQTALPFQVAQSSAINVDSTQGNHLIDKLKYKQNQTQPEAFKMQKHAQKPWTLTPNLLAFLQNMSKNNESGKVLPWQYTKQLINQIYEERNNYQGQMAVGGIGNSMGFDEFLIFYFLHKHRIRRLAEVKLLQFIISLKYYSRYWPKAEMFCQLMDVMRYQPLFENSDGFNYKLDFNTQNFFFAIYKKMVTYSTVQEEGATYVSVKQVKKLMRASLYFTDQVNKSRLLAKLDKDLRVYDKVDHCDFDYALLLILDEYFVTKKKICNSLTRAFSKKFQDNQGYFSLDEMKELFSQQSHLYRAGQQLQYRFPIASDLQICKLYLFAATAGKNSYDFNVNHFIASAQRYGFDAPFPFLHYCSKSKRAKEQSKEFKADQQQQKKQTKQKQVIKTVSVEQLRNQQKIQISQTANLARQRIDIGVKLFSQHFSILKELYTYVDIFSKTLKQQKNVEALWKSFEQIRTVLHRGCEFMRYPLLSKANQ